MSKIRSPLVPRRFSEWRRIFCRARTNWRRRSVNGEMMQKRLEAYRDRYVDLYDFAPVGYVTFDEEGYIQEINLAGARLLGRELPELVGYPFMDHVVVPDRATFLQHIQKCCGKQQDVTSELSLIAKDGRLIAAHLRSVPIAAIEHEGTFCKTAITDITERKRAEQALRESEHRLRFALEGIEAGEWDLNLADHTAYRSLQHDRIFGYETLLPEWSYEMFLEHVVPEDRQLVDQKVGQAIEARCAWDFECRIVRRDHSVRGSGLVGGPSWMKTASRITWLALSRTSPRASRPRRRFARAKHRPEPAQQS